jgi:hypothetical protein
MPTRPRTARALTPPSLSYAWERRRAVHDTHPTAQSAPQTQRTPDQTWLPLASLVPG